MTKIIYFRNLTQLAKFLGSDCKLSGRFGCTECNQYLGVFFQGGDSNLTLPLHLFMIGGSTGGKLVLLVPLLSTECKRFKSGLC